MKITMQAISKAFGPNQVLQGVDLTLTSGEVHALMGENGAGKSTLMKILTGIHRQDQGVILREGQEVRYQNPKEAEEAGIVLIHQELNTMEDLSILDNLYMGREITRAWGILDRKKMEIGARKVLGDLGVQLDPLTPMSQLSVGEQQMVEICKALMVDARLLIMDEPTAALTAAETDQLFRVIRALKTRGVSIVYISHRMEEIFELCDRVTVLRDGISVGTKEIHQVNMNDIVKMMIGRELGDRFPQRDHQIGDRVLEVRNLSYRGLFEDINFHVHAGEILGVSGLMGAGRSEIMSTIFGFLKKDQGEILLHGQPIEIKSPADAIRQGLAYVTEDRKSQGLILDQSIEENITLTNLDSLAPRGLLDQGKIKETAEDLVRTFRIRSRDIHQKCRDLSGGNQQKVALGKWMPRKPQVLILDEPTRGVDIGAKQDIYQRMNQLADAGVAIIMISSELPEILGMSDRILVIREGQGRGSLPIEEADQEKVMTLATGGSIHDQP